MKSTGFGIILLLSHIFKVSFCFCFFFRFLWTKREFCVCSWILIWAYRAHSICLETNISVYKVDRKRGRVRGREGESHMHVMNSHGVSYLWNDKYLKWFFEWGKRAIIIVTGRSLNLEWMNHLTPNDKHTHNTACVFVFRLSVEPLSVQYSNRIFDKFSLNWNPLKRVYAKPSAELHIRDQVQVHDGTSKVCCLHHTNRIFLFDEPSSIGRHNWFEQSKKKSVLKVRHFCRAIKEREMRTQAISIVILSPHRQLNTKSRNVITISPQPRYERNILWRKSMNGKISRLLLN